MKSKYRIIWPLRRRWWAFTYLCRRLLWFPSRFWGQYYGRRGWGSTNDDPDYLELFHRLAWYPYPLGRPKLKKGLIRKIGPFYWLTKEAMSKRHTPPISWDKLNEIKRNLRAAGGAPGPMGTGWSCTGWRRMRDVYE